MWLLTKERLWAKCSPRSLQTVSDWLPLLMTKHRRERFTLFHERIALLLAKKRAILLKNQWANSQTWLLPSTVNICFFRNYRRYFVKFTPVEAHYIFWSVGIKWTLWQSILTKVVQRGISWVIFINGILKGIVSRDFRCLQQILMDRAWVPGIPLDVYFFLNSCFQLVCMISLKFLAG